MAWAGGGGAWPGVAAPCAPLLRLPAADGDGGESSARLLVPVLPPPSPSLGVPPLLSLNGAAGSGGSAVAVPAVRQREGRLQGAASSAPSANTAA
jgi:hypothetical protein